MTDEKSQSVGIWDMPARKPHPGRPLRRTFIDQDGDLWQIGKDHNELMGIVEGQLVRKQFDEVAQLYGPLVELDSSHGETATDNLLDTQSANLVRMLRECAAHVECYPHHTEAQRAAVAEALSAVAQQIENHKRKIEG